MPSREHPPSCDAPELRARVREGLLATYFQTYDPVYLASPGGQADVDTHVFGRYDTCAEYVLPWVQSFGDLAGAHIVEVGCGTGSSTAGFAWMAERVDGYDIDGPSIDGAHERMRALGIDNVGLHLAPAESILDLIAANHAPGTVDFVLLYAVLEHQTLEERLRCIEISWDILRDGGLLVVVETPNRLALWDYHTSLLPFFHMLPEDLALRYYVHSPREPFTVSIREALASSADEARLTLTRWGRGIGSHEFELVLGDLAPLLVANGYEDEMTRWWPVQNEDRLLQAFFADKEIDVPIAFTRHVLNFMLRKGGRNARDTAIEALEPPVAVGEGATQLLMERASLASQLDELQVAYAALAGSPAVRVSRRLTRYPHIHRLGAAGWRAARRLRDALPHGGR